MIASDLILNPDHYVAGRVIQPIEVIEAWRLCHHLACVVKYMARYKRKSNPLQDLQKAEWYLERELSRSQHGFSKCQLQLIDPRTVTPEDVAIDWELSPWLGEVLELLKGTQDKHLKGGSLHQALQLLRKERQDHEK